MFQGHALGQTLTQRVSNKSHKSVRTQSLLPWLAVGHIFLKHSFKNIDHVLIGDFEIEVSVHDLPARVAGRRVPETRLITRIQGLLHKQTETE
jgi:hypothetical protein